MGVMSEEQSNRGTRAGADAPLLLVAGQKDELSEALVPWLSASLAPCCVRSVLDGDACVEAVRSQHPWAVLIDHYSDGVSGLETTRRIKQEWPATAVVMLSLYDAEAYRTEARQAGASDYVLKSRVAHDLLPCLQALLQSGETS